MRSFSSSSPQNKKRPKRKWLIVAEDSKSSLLYFKGFPIDESKLEIYSVGGMGDPQSVVETARDLQLNAIANKRPFAEIWTIFDRDDWPVDRYQNALAIARDSNIKTAWSNEAFELWYILHFALRDTAMHRHEYKSWLDADGRLGVAYSKADNSIYNLLQVHQRTALRNSDKLLSGYENSGNHDERRFPERQNPSVNIQKLVRELNEFLRPSLPAF